MALCLKGDEAVVRCLGIYTRPSLFEGENIDALSKEPGASFNLGACYQQVIHPSRRREKTHSNQQKVAGLRTHKYAGDGHKIETKKVLQERAARVGRANATQAKVSDSLRPRIGREMIARKRRVI